MIGNGDGDEAVQRAVERHERRHPQPDRLRVMFDLQSAFQSRLVGGEWPRDCPSEISKFVTAIVSEMGEILEEDQRWKTWRKEPLPVDRGRLLGEYVDLVHHVVNLGLALNFDDEDLYAAFVRKNRVNNERQDSGY